MAKTLATGHRGGPTTSTYTGAGRALGARPTLRQDPKTTLLQQHPRYLEWIDVWRWLGYAYEGDGPYLSGAALVPHPRETMYPAGDDGQPNYAGTPVLSPKYRRRQELASYLNLAQPLTDTVIDYLFTGNITRTGAQGNEDFEAYRRWLDNVDGLGTSFDDWLKDAATMAAVYGMIAVSLERAPGPLGAEAAPRSRADEGPLVLNYYTPLDILDWVWSQRSGLTAIKVLEGVPRDTVAAPFFLPVGDRTVLGSAGSEDLDDAGAVEVRVWDKRGLTAYDALGMEKGAAPLPPSLGGRPPFVFLYHRRRRRIPFIGASVLGDPKLYRDHYNQWSELRDLMRSNVFSMLAIGLREGEEVAEARARLGPKMSTDTIVWHAGGAEFISPSDSPVLAYVAVMDALERKMFRRVGLSWTGGDSHVAEAADSRRIKAMDLNRILSGQADECQRFEYALAELWFRRQYADDGTRFRTAEVKLTYPDEFYVQQAAEALSAIKEADGVGFGPTLRKVMRKSAVPILVSNVDEKTKQQIEADIDALIDTDETTRTELTRLQLEDAANTAAEGGGSPTDIDTTPAGARPAGSGEGS